jgi:hypothetical protein
LFIASASMCKLSRKPAPRAGVEALGRVEERGITNPVAVAAAVSRLHLIDGDR